MNIYTIVILNVVLLCVIAKKDITSYTDADLDRLYDQWEDNDEDSLEDDELPEHKRPQKQMDLESMKAKAKNPEDLLMMSKKGQTLMMFINVRNTENPGPTTRDFTEHWTSLWQGQLHNNHIDSQVFIIEDNRAIFMFKDGAQAFESKKFLIEQQYVEHITIEGQLFEGPAYSKKKSEL